MESARAARARAFGSALFVCSQRIRGVAPPACNCDVYHRTPPTEPREKFPDESDVDRVVATLRNVFDNDDFPPLGAAASGAASAARAATTTTVTTHYPCSVIRADTLDAARFARHSYPGTRVAVLNMASASNPGGNPAAGASTQEEALCRSSDLYLRLANSWVTRNAGQRWTTPPQSMLIAADRKWQYPLAPGSVVYSPGVQVFAHSEARGFAPAPLFAVDVLTAAAPRVVRGTTAPYNSDAMRARISAVLRVAEHHKIDTLVLGAWGCGAFGNPSDVVARLFREELHAARPFRCVLFAIVDGRRAANVSSFEAQFGASLQPAYDEFEKTELNSA